MQIDEFIEDRLSKHLGVKNLFYYEDNKILSLTNHELLTKSHSVKKTLQEIGLKPGQRVAIVGENSVAWIITYIAIFLAKGIAVTLDSEQLPEDLNNNLQWLDPSLIVCSQLQEKKCHFNKPHVSFDQLLNGQDQEKLSIKACDTTFINSENVRTMVQSSGTGGQSKSIQLTDQNLIDVISIYQGNLDSSYSKGYVLNVLPLSAIYPTVICLACLCCGIPFLIVNPKTENVLEILSKEKIYCLPAVPLILELIHKNILEKIQQQTVFNRGIFWPLFYISKFSRKWGFNLGKPLFKKIHSYLNVELFITGGAPLPVAISRDLSALGFTIQEGFGLTETSGVISHTDGGYPNLGTVGHVVKGIEIKINQSNQDGSGEILIKGRLMAGYFRNEEATQKAIRDGWLHTGDIGKYDRRGNLIIVGRIKDVIVSSDERKTIPEEIEKHYKAIEGIKKLAVVGIPTQAGGYDNVHAAISLEERFVLKFNGDQATAFEKIKESILEKANQLPHHLQISFVHLVPVIPVNNLGKTKRAALIDILLAKY